MEQLNWMPFGLLGLVAYSDFGRYEVVPQGNTIIVTRNRRLIHTAGDDFDAATAQAQIDHDDRARRAARRRTSA